MARATGGELMRSLSLLSERVKGLRPDGVAVILSVTEKVPQRQCVTKILPNIQVNLLVRFASSPIFTG